MNIVSLSYGKDSTAMLLMMLERGIQVDKIIFADTQYELPEMIEYQKVIDKLLLQAYGLIVTKTKPETTFEHWFYNKPVRGENMENIRGFPTVVFPWWSREAKIKPIQKEEGTGNILYIGIAKDEEERSKAKMYINKKNKYKFPLVKWNISEKECYAYLKKRNLQPPTKLRTGCWWCPKQSKKSLKNLHNNHPELWKQLKQWEKDSPNGFKIDFTLDKFEVYMIEENKQTSVYDYE